MKVLVLLASLLAPAVAAASPTISVWARAPGLVDGSEELPPPDARKLDLGRFTTVEQTFFDPQYQTTMRFRGLPLSTVLASLPGGPALDTALLRFDNGMLISISRWPLEVESPFLALQYSEDGKVWSVDFPEVPKKGHEADDPRPIRFKGHKLVYGGPAARDLPAWNPWRHATSLVGIELVNLAAWERQFTAADSRGSTEGRALYTEFCRSCHGVRGVGARFGWDVVSPVPLARHRSSPGMLYYHVRFRELDAAERGFMMPAIPPITEARAEAIWKWMAAAAEHPLLPYQPPTSR